MPGTVSLPRDLLSIPHGASAYRFYTVADGSDGVLKVMRSYQYQAANAISDKVAKSRWEAENLGAKPARRFCLAYNGFRQDHDFIQVRSTDRRLPMMRTRLSF